MPEVILNSADHISYIVMLLFSGGVSLLSFFIILVYFKTKEKIYLFYFLFLICGLLSAMINIVHLGWGKFNGIDSYQMLRRNLETFTLLAVFFYCLFTINLLEIRRKNKSLANWIMFLAGITAVYGCVYWLIYPWIFVHEKTFFIVSRAVIMPMSLVAIVWVSAKIHSIFKSYFIIGSSLYFTGAFLAILRQSTTFIPFDFFYQLSPVVYFQSGIFLEITCFTLALSLRVYLLYQSKQIKTVKERDLAMAQVLAAETQNNSHLIFNSLNVIKYLIQTQQKEAALNQLNTYSKFVRSIIETAQEQQISLRKELKIVELYLALESSRLGFSLVQNIHISPEIDLDDTFLPPMLLQSFTEKFIWKKTRIAPYFYFFKDEEESVNVLIINEKLSTANCHQLPQVLQQRFEEVDFENERIDLYNRTHSSKIHCFTLKKQQQTEDQYAICVQISEGFSVSVSNK